MLIENGRSFNPQPLTAYAVSGLQMTTIIEGKSYCINKAGIRFVFIIS
jgi:hypothetical protein